MRCTLTPSLRDLRACLLVNIGMLEKEPKVTGRIGSSPLSVFKPIPPCRAHKTSWHSISRRQSSAPSPAAALQHTPATRIALDGSGRSGHTPGSQRQPDLSAIRTTPTHAHEQKPTRGRQDLLPTANCEPTLQNSLRTEKESSFSGNVPSPEIRMTKKRGLNPTPLFGKFAPAVSGGTAPGTSRGTIPELKIMPVLLHHRTLLKRVAFIFPSSSHYDLQTFPPLPTKEIRSRHTSQIFSHF